MAEGQRRLLFSPHSKCWAAREFPENLFVGKLPSRNQNVKLDNPYFGEIGGKIELWSYP